MKIKKILLSGVAALTLVGCGITDTPSKKEEAPAKPEDQVTVSKEVVDVKTDITTAVEKTAGAVVTVINLQDNRAQELPFFFGGQVEEEIEEGLQPAGTGSGAVYKITKDRAYLFTNNHVVDGSDSLEVLFNDGRRVEAELEGSDIWTDLAVISIPAKDAEVALEFGDSEALKVGEPAIAIGSPLGTDFASSVTSGIISAKSRSVPVDTTGDGRPDWEMTVLQTDAAINPGNSGGPLINIEGQVIGINSMKISVEEVEGMGFAIPSTDAVQIIDQLEKEGQVVRPELGVSIIDLHLISAAYRQQELNLPHDVTEGVVLMDVDPTRSAGKAGLEPGDVIVKMDETEIDGSIQLRRFLHSQTLGSEVDVTYYRGDKEETVTVTLEE